MPDFLKAVTDGSHQAPGAGEFNQMINPWSWLFKFVGNQFSLITVNLGKSSDPHLEDEILKQVGSYGSQLGQIGDALRVLIRHTKLDDLAPAEQRAITAVQYQLDRIEALKEKRTKERMRALSP